MASKPTGGHQRSNNWTTMSSIPKLAGLTLMRYWPAPKAAKLNVYCMRDCSKGYHYVYTVVSKFFFTMKVENFVLYIFVAYNK